MTNFLKKFVLSIALVSFFYSCGSDPEVIPEDVLSTKKEILSFQVNSVNGIIDANAHKISVTLPHYTDVTKLSPIIKVSEKATLSPNTGKTVDFSKPVTYTVTAEDKSTQDYTVAVTKEAFKPIVTNTSKIDGLLGGETFTLLGYFATEGNIVKLIDEEDVSTVLEIVSEDSVSITVETPVDLTPKEYSISVTSQGITVVLETKLKIAEPPVFAPTISSATINNKKVLTVAGEYFVDIENLSLMVRLNDMVLGAIFTLPEEGVTAEITKSSIVCQIPETVEIDPLADHYITIRTAKGTTESFKITFIE